MKNHRLDSTLCNLQRKKCNGTTSRIISLNKHISKKRKKKTRKQLLADEVTSGDRFSCPKFIENNFPIGSHGEYISYSIEEIVDQVSLHNKELRRLVREQSGKVSLDFFQQPPTLEDLVSLEEIKERGIYNVARYLALKKLGFLGKAWHWDTVFSVIAEETWRRRKLRESYKEQRILKDAREAEEMHRLPLDD